MHLFGLQITRAAAPPRLAAPVAGAGSGWTTIFDSDRSQLGSWQQDVDPKDERVLSYSPVYACITLIANDFGKLKQCLFDKNSDGILNSVNVAAFSPVLSKPNPFQNHIQFKQWWIMSKLDFGNTYVLKERDGRGVVVALYILNPRRVTTLVAEDGSVYYQLGEDYLSEIGETVTVPASEIIHDRMNCLFHPLCGISPLYAAALVAAQGLGIQRDSLTFFKNGSSPGGVLTAPGQILDATAKRAKEYWDDNFAGRNNSGKVAVLGDGLKFEPMRMSSADAQVTEQLMMSAKFICSAYHVPPFKIGLEEIPKGQKVSDLNQIYYNDCLQSLIEEYELCLGEGLGLPSVVGHDYSVQLDLDGLLRMDQASLIAMLGDGVKGSVFKINEARARINLSPIDGGDTVYMQQQNFSVAALDARDKASPAPSSVNPAPPAAADAPQEAKPSKAILDLTDKFHASEAATREVLQSIGDMRAAQDGLAVAALAEKQAISERFDAALDGLRSIAEAVASESSARKAGEAARLQAELEAARIRDAVEAERLESERQMKAFADLLIANFDAELVS